MAASREVAMETSNKVVMEVTREATREAMEVTSEATRVAMEVTREVAMVVATT
jgi:hypothetical protein